MLQDVQKSDESQENVSVVNKDSTDTQQLPDKHEEGSKHALNIAVLVRLELLIACALSLSGMVNKNCMLIKG